MKPTLLAIALTLSVSLSAQSKHYWVSAGTGNDTNPGTKALPFKTLEKGLTISKLDAVIHIGVGTYGPNSTGDFLDTTQTPAVEKDIVLRDYKNVKILGDDRDKCIVDFNGNHGMFWGFISVRGTSTDGLEIANLTFKNILPTAATWGGKWGCGAVIINGNAGKTDIHGCAYIDANAAYINWGTGTDNAFHHNLIVRTIAGARANAVRIRHKLGSTTYIYNNTMVNQDIGIGLAGGVDIPGQVVANNLIIDGTTGMAGNGPLAAAAVGGVLENNNCFNNSTNYATVWPASNLSVDPQLVDKANGNYRQKPTSPGIDGGHSGFMMYQLNDYYGGASCVDMSANGNAAPDVGCHELATVLLTVPAPWVQGGTALLSLTSSDPTYVLGFYALGILPPGAGPTPFYKIDPFGTLGMDPAGIMILTLVGLPATNNNPIQGNIPITPLLNDAMVYLQGFSTLNGNRFQASGAMAINL